MVVEKDQLYRNVCKDDQVCAVWFTRVVSASVQVCVIPGDVYWDVDRY